MADPTALVRSAARNPRERVEGRGNRGLGIWWDSSGEVCRDFGKRGKMGNGERGRFYACTCMIREWNWVSL